MTPLWKAAFRGYTQIAMALLDAGAGTDIQDKVYILLIFLFI